MINVENIQIYGWEAAIKKYFKNKGIRCRKKDSYETYVSNHGKFLSCGTYTTKEEAIKAVVSTKIKLFKENIISNSDNPAEIVETPEKGYFASPNGYVYNKHGNVMIGAIDHCGYRHIILNKKNKNVHRIIAETFIPNPNNLPCINHKDGNKLNNQVSNLEWCTHSENTQHAYSIGLEQKQYGEKHHAHKLTESNVKYIKSNYDKKDKLNNITELSIMFGVHRKTILDVIKGKTWRHVS